MLFLWESRKKQSHFIIFAPYIKITCVRHDCMSIVQRPLKFRRVMPVYLTWHPKRDDCHCGCSTTKFNGQIVNGTSNIFKKILAQDAKGSTPTNAVLPRTKSSIVYQAWNPALTISSTPRHKR